jgi:hypothetical protein
LGSFLNHLPANPTSKIKLKVLVTAHVLIGDYNKGQEFSNKFIAWAGWKEAVKYDCDSRLIKQYFTFLQKLAHNFSILQVAKMKTYPPANGNRTNLAIEIVESILVYYKIINILNNLFTQRDVP